MPWLSTFLQSAVSFIDYKDGTCSTWCIWNFDLQLTDFNNSTYKFDDMKYEFCISRLTKHISTTQLTSLDLQDWQYEFSISRLAKRISTTRLTSLDLQDWRLENGIWSLAKGIRQIKFEFRCVKFANGLRLSGFLLKSYMHPVQYVDGVRTSMWYLQTMCSVDLVIVLFRVDNTCHRSCDLVTRHTLCCI